MRAAYPVIFSKDGDGYFVSIPDFGINTQGGDMAESISMARDAIGLMGIDMQDDGKAIPDSGSVVYEVEEGDIVSYVDVNFSLYRRKLENLSVKKNCTIPYWLEQKADEVGVNYSQVLQEALIQKVGDRI